jgi:Tfp pilus assembly protein PilO
VKKRKIPVLVLVAVGVLVATAAAWALLVRPLSGKIDTARAQVDGKQSEIAAAQKQLESTKPAENTIKVADLVELAKAMPDNPDMADAILELNAAAKGAGVDFASITPGQPASGAGYTQLPLQLSFIGNYYDLSELLYRIRELVSVREGVLDARGRLYTLDSIDWHEGPDGFPQVQADLTVSAYVFGSSGLAATPATGGATSATSTATSSTSTYATSTTPTATTSATETSPASTAPTTTPAQAPEAAGAPEVNQ